MNEMLVDCFGSSSIYLGGRRSTGRGINRLVSNSSNGNRVGVMRSSDLR